MPVTPDRVRRISPASAFGGSTGSAAAVPAADPVGPGRWSRAAWLVLGAILAGHAVAAWLGRQILVRHGQDDAWYILLARSLRQLRYVDLFVVGQPIHQLYPPGYPAALTLTSLFTGESVTAFVILSILASATAITFTYLAWRRLLDWRIALLVAAALAANPELVQRAGMIVSEPLFVALTMAVLWLSFTEKRNERPWRLALLGGLAIAAALTRTIGIALVGALVIHWALQRRWRAVIWLTAACLATVGAWVAWTVFAPDQFVGKSYIADLTRVRRAPSPVPLLVRRVFAAVRYYLEKGVPWAMAAPTIPGTPVDNAAIAALIAGGLIGGTLAMLKRWRLAALHVAGSVAILLVYPWLLHRFVVPLLPLILPFMAYALIAGSRRFAPRLGVALAVALLAGVTVNGLLRTSAQVQRTMACDRSGTMPPDACLPPDAVSYFAALRHINAALPADAVVAAAKAAPLYYYTGRQTPPVGAVFAQRPENFLAFLEEVGANYVLLGRLHNPEGRSLIRSVRANCAALELEGTFPPSTFLFRVATRPTAEGAARSCAAADSYRGRWDNSEQW